MTYLVTGGAGFIGRATVRALRAEGLDVVVLDSLTYAAHEADLRSIEGVEVVVGDVDEPADVAAVFERFAPSVVLNLAAESHVDRSLEDASPFVRANTLGPWVVARACAEAGVRMVQVSTDEVYGDRDGLPPSVEGDPTTPTNPYSAAKAAGDAMALSLVRSDGLDAVVTRGANTYGPGQYPEKLLPLAAQRWANGATMGVYGDGLQEREWIFVDDHASGILAAARRGASGGIFHLGGDAPTPNLDLLDRWRAALGYPPMGKEAWLAHVADRRGHDRRYRLASERTRELLRWSPSVDLAAGLAATAAWHDANPDFWTN